MGSHHQDLTNHNVNQLTTRDTRSETRSAAFAVIRAVKARGQRAGAGSGERHGARLPHPCCHACHRAQVGRAPVAERESSGVARAEQLVVPPRTAVPPVAPPGAAVAGSGGADRWAPDPRISGVGPGGRFGGHPRRPSAGGRRSWPRDLPRPGSRSGSGTAAGRRPCRRQGRQSTHGTPPALTGAPAGPAPGPVGAGPDGASGGAGGW